MDWIHSDADGRDLEVIADPGQQRRPGAGERSTVSIVLFACRASDVPYGDPIRPRLRLFRKPELDSVPSLFAF
jgi:hypothetical protein